jgi:hypothetical protein
LTFFCSNTHEKKLKLLNCTNLRKLAILSINP